jgi:hypothetical protein
MCAVIVLTTQKENGAKGEYPGTKGSKRFIAPDKPSKMGMVPNEISPDLVMRPSSGSARNQTGLSVRRIIREPRSGRGSP